jgi:hypothetical protein
MPASHAIRPACLMVVMRVLSQGRAAWRTRAHDVMTMTAKTMEPPDVNVR